MYKVMIVDDEPPIIRSTRRMIANCSLHFELVAEAYNGIEALEKIILYKPDIVFTDIKMPAMNGISLVQQINELYPSIYPVIISGYQDFNYAQEALRSGVVDYLLKPIEPEQMNELLIGLRQKLEKEYHAASAQLLQRIIRCLPCEEDRVLRYLNFNEYAAVLIRSGALQSRSQNKPYLRYSNLLDSLNFKQLGAQLKFDSYWFFEGSDPNEILLIFGYKEKCSVTSESLSEAIYSMLNQSRSQITLVHAPFVSALDPLYEVVQKQNQILNQYLVLGRSQILNIAQFKDKNKIHLPGLGNNLENKLAILIRGNSIDSLKLEVDKLMRTWEQQAYPQIRVEQLLKQLLRLIQKESPSMAAETTSNFEYDLEEAISSAADFNAMTHQVWEIFKDMLVDKTVKINTQATYEKIETYIVANLSDPLTLQEICDLFGISQPQLSRLFRKNNDLSFKEYMTQKRIDEAKRLMAEHPDMLLKDIAEVTGYQDQHYFSRIFKLVTGVSPSDYRR